MINNRDTRPGENIERRIVFSHKIGRSALHVEDEHPKTPLLRDFRVELPQCAGRKISWIGCGLLSFRLLFFIEAVEILMRHIDLSAKLQRVKRKIDGFRDIRNHQRIRCYILPDKSVSARLGKPERKFSGIRILRVAKRHGEPVDFLFHGKLCSRMHLLHLVHPVGHVFFGEEILDREHRNIMCDLNAGLPLCRSADFLCR